MMIFRHYDIRGIAGETLTPDIMRDIGRAFGSMVPGSLVVGRDIRLSSETLQRALITGLRESGCDILDIGLVTTPMLYFGILHLQAEGGLMVTASHNPAEYNGVKLCKGLIPFYGADIQALRQRIDSKEFVDGKGQYATADLKGAYLQHLLSKMSLKTSFKIVIDTGNGSAGLVASDFFRDLKCDVISLFGTPDGHFPHHHPDPTVPENLTALIKTVKEERAALGLAFDGDGDRLGVVDGKGRIIPGDQLLMVFSRSLLRPGDSLVFDVKCSQALEQEISRLQGTPLMWKTGHPHIKEKMREEQAVIGGELSGHLIFQENHYWDDALFAAGKLLMCLEKEQTTLAHLIDQLPRYSASPEVRIPCAEKKKFAVVEEIKEAFATRPHMAIDGIRIRFPDGWALVRASNTEPALIMRFEAATEEALQGIRDEVETEVLKRAA